MPTPQIVIYTRQGCHLCDDARAMVQQAGIQPEMIDIDQSPELQSEFDQCVPVVQINGKVRFRGRVNSILLRRAIEAETTDSAEPSL